MFELDPPGLPLGVNVGLLLLRGVVGIVMAAHGWNHVAGGIDGTAGWFDSLGMRPPRLHAWLASLVELVAGAMLVVGLLTPLAAAGVVGVMVVAWVANHAGNGFFIFNEGEGWEYVMVLAVVATAVAAVGPGEWSLDHLLGLRVAGVVGLLSAVLLGAGGAGVLLALCWRPERG